MKSSYTSPLRGCAKQQPDYPPAASIAQHPMGLLACMLDAAAGPRGTPARHAHRSAAPTRADRLIGLMGDFGMGTRRLPQPAPSFLAQPGAAQLVGYLAGGRGQFGVAFQPAAAKLLDLPRVRARRHGRPAGVPEVVAVSARANCSEPSRRSLPASCWSAFPDWTCGTSSSRLRSAADHRVDAGLASGAGGLDVQPVGILAADHPDEGAFAGEPLGPVPGGGIGQVEGAPVGVAAASTARRERAGRSDKRFRMPRSPAGSLLVVPQGFPATPRGAST